MIAEHAHPAIVADRIDRLAAAGRSFTADDVRRELPTETIAWLGENGSRLGNCFKSAKARGSIRKAGWRNSS
ncbi:hypothetical protein, partial [Tsukamurella pulmonis]|uniref:hypothetical protein n=2 Tax=Tsukamurella TaxID=2060 RepID=UPI000B2A8541